MKIRSGLFFILRQRRSKFLSRLVHGKEEAAYGLVPSGEDDERGATIPLEDEGVMEGPYTSQYIARRDLLFTIIRRKVQMKVNV
jgi:hypothetical protein